MKKNIYALLLTAALAAGSLSGCGGNGTSGAEGSSQAGNAANQEAGSGADTVTIQYWQYAYDSKVAMMDELIKEFESANPTIKIEHITYPYDSYFEKMAASIVTAQSSGVGPNIINYNCVDTSNYYAQGVLQPLPTDVFDPAVIDQEFSPLVQMGKINDVYYSLPTAVRTYAMFYNKKLLEENGYTEADLPKTWEEYADMAEKMTVWEGNNLKIAGSTMDKDGRLSHWFRILNKGMGGDLYGQDNKTAEYNSDTAKKSLDYLIDMYKNRKVSVSGFTTSDQVSFATGVAALHIDGSFRIATIKEKVGDSFEWGVAELPTWENGEKATYGDYWCNSITSFTKGPELDASVKFLQFLTSEDVMKRWSLATGEIGARMAFAEDQDLLSDPYMAPFIEALPYAFTSFSTKRYSVDDACKEIFETSLLGDGDPGQTLDTVNAKVQESLDEFWSEFE